MDITVRFAAEQDIPRIMDLLHQVQDVHHDIRPDLFRAGGVKYDESTLHRLLADSSRPILVAIEDDILVGYAFCILQVTKDDPLLCDRRVLYIDDLCVDDAWRGKGIARILYQKTLDFAKSLGCNALTLNVWWGNDRALRFYEKCGLQKQKIGMEKVL